MEHQASAKLEGRGGMIAQALNERLTEEGLKRIIAKNSSYDRRDINRLQLDDLGRRIGYGPRMRVARKKPERYGKKAKAKRVRASMPMKPWKNYWARVKKEIHIFICTDDKKYANLRRQITKGKSQTVIVTSVAGGIAYCIGIGAAGATVIMPLVAAAFLIFLEVGINAYCAGGP